MIRYNWRFWFAAFLLSLSGVGAKAEELPDWLVRPDSHFIRVQGDYTAQEGALTIQVQFSAKSAKPDFEALLVYAEPSHTLLLAQVNHSASELLARENPLAIISSPLGSSIPKVVVPFDSTEDSEIVVQLLSKGRGRVTLLKSPVDFDHFDLSDGFEGVAADAQFELKAAGKFTHCCWGGAGCGEMCVTCSSAYFFCDLVHCSIFCG